MLMLAAGLTKAKIWLSADAFYRARGGSGRVMVLWRIQKENTQNKRHTNSTCKEKKITQVVGDCSELVQPGAFLEGTPHCFQKAAWQNAESIQDAFWGSCGKLSNCKCEITGKKMRGNLEKKCG